MLIEPLPSLHLASCVDGPSNVGVHSHTDVKAPFSAHFSIRAIWDEVPCRVLASLHKPLLPDPARAKANVVLQGVCAATYNAALEKRSVGEYETLKFEYKGRVFTIMS